MTSTADSKHGHLKLTIVATKCCGQVGKTREHNHFHIGASNNYIVSKLRMPQKLINGLLDT